MLSEWCKTQNIPLVILQGYNIPWNDNQLIYLEIINNLNSPLYNQYKQSTHYANHNHTNHNSVPCIGYHVDLAIDVAQLTDNHLLSRLQKLKEQLNKTS